MHDTARPGPCVSSTTVLQSMKLGVDVNRHKEVIVKAISAVLLLLLKHFKLNHVYQVPAGPAFLSTCLSSATPLALRAEVLSQKPSELCLTFLRHSPPTKAWHPLERGCAPTGALIFLPLVSV